MNSTPHTTATRFFFPERYAESEAGRAEVKKRATEDFRQYLERVQARLGEKSFWFRDAYVFTLLRWGGYAGIDPKSLPAYYAYAQKLTQAPPIAAALARERISLDTYKA
jgi:glutathione S-transferase